jgi:hypothetical protein
VPSVYSLFSALIMHVYQMRSSNQSIVSATQQRLTTCMNALRDVSKVWLVAKMVHTLFESILGNKVLEERLQKAAGRRHAKSKQNGHSGSRTVKTTPPNELQQQANEAQKRKFDDMELGYVVNGPPAPQVSYERSRPQSPAVTPGRELPAQPNPQPAQPTQLPNISASSPPLRQSTDAFMGTSRANTRPTTPFNAFSYPGTPPDLFLHTRNSPKISEDLWQNYDPGQLFPPEANGIMSSFPLLSPGDGIDPALRQPPSQPSAQMVPPTSHQQHMSLHDGQAPPPSMHPQQTQMPPTFQDPQAQQWHQMHQMSQQGSRIPDDQWSQTSSTGPIVPTTLNVGDWFEFFGIPNGDVSALGGLGQGQATQQAGYG